MNMIGYVAKKTIGSAVKMGIYAGGFAIFAANVIHKKSKHKRRKESIDYDFVEEGDTQI